MPLLLFGPFGTGKTAVMIEIVKQILRNVPQSRLLVCAPSNSAADVFASKLAVFEDLTSSSPTSGLVGGLKSSTTKLSPPVVKEPTLLRLYASRRPREAVPPAVLPFTCWNEQLALFDVPSLEQLGKYRVIVTTCNSASLLHSAAVPAGFFSHILIDEAAQLYV